MIPCSLPWARRSILTHPRWRSGTGFGALAPPCSQATESQVSSPPQILLPSAAFCLPLFSSCQALSVFPRPDPSCFVHPILSQGSPSHTPPPGESLLPSPPSTPAAPGSPDIFWGLRHGQPHLSYLLHAPPSQPRKDKKTGRSLTRSTASTPQPGTSSEMKGWRTAAHFRGRNGCLEGKRSP